MTSLSPNNTVWREIPYRIIAPKGNTGRGVYLFTSHFGLHSKQSLRLRPPTFHKSDIDSKSKITSALSNFNVSIVHYWLPSIFEKELNLTISTEATEKDITEVTMFVSSKKMAADAAATRRERNEAHDKMSLS